MPTLTVDGQPFEVPAGKRLVNALIEDAKADQLHSCGGHAKCTTCRVQFVAGEPERMTQAERDVLAANKLLGTPGLRLSCQIICDHDMSMQVISKFEGSGKKDAGKPCGPEIDPPAVWVEKA